MDNLKDYLGDSVYASFDGEYIKLTCENGQDIATETIYLDSEVYKALVAYHDRVCGLQVGKKL